MPVTAKLSRKFYDALGDDVANELVEWFNRVDLTYRTELRDLNEVNFARFEARLEQRVAELRAELRQEIGRLDARVEHGFGEQAARLDSKLEALRAELIKWMFVFWIGSVGLALLINQFG